MNDAADQPVAVLDYAPAAPAGRASRFLRSAALVASFAAGFFLATYLLQRSRFVAVGYMAVGSPNPMANLAAVRSAQTSADATVRAAIPSAVASLNGTQPAVTAAEIQSGLSVKPIADSRLVAVQFESNRPARAAAIATAVMKASATPNLAVATFAAIPSAPTGMLALPLGAFIIAILIGSWAAVLLSRTQRPRRL